MDNWSNNQIQFPRLIAEIVATQDQLDVLALAESMDLQKDDIQELFDRAQTEWENIKQSPVVPSCEAGDTRGWSNLGMVCQSCNTTVEHTTMNEPSRQILSNLMYKLATDGVDPAAAALHVLGKADSNFVEHVKNIQNEHGMDYSRAILTVAAKAVNDPNFSEKIEIEAENSRKNSEILERNIGAAVQMSEGFYTDLTAQIKTNNDMTQLLGVALRGVLPYAENEVFALAGAYQKDREEVLRDEYERGSECVTRAQQALNILNASPLSVDGLADDAMDDTFEIKFEDEGEE